MLDTLFDIKSDMHCCQLQITLNACTVIRDRRDEVCALCHIANLVINETELVQCKVQAEAGETVEHRACNCAQKLE